MWDPGPVGSLYDVLGVEVDASEVELRHAYHRRARVLHPDRHAGAPEAQRLVTESAMRQLNAAWEVLGDPARRGRYDAALVRARTTSVHRTRPTTAGRPAPGFESVTDWVQTWGDVDAADAAMGRRRHGTGDGFDEFDDDDLYGSVGVPVWFHRLTVVAIFAVLAALLIGSAYASHVTPDDELPGRGGVDVDGAADE
jgi:curved DNA-binding protein CbpA